MQTVLLIDDDQLLRGMYAHKFSERGFTVEAAESADEGLEKLRAGLAPSLVVFDIVMPGTDGFGFLEALAKENLVPQAIRIALSNQTSPEDEQRAMSLGATAFIVKATAVPSEIVEQVLGILEHKAGAAVPIAAPEALAVALEVPAPLPEVPAAPPVPTDTVQGGETSPAPASNAPDAPQGRSGAEQPAA